MRAAFIALLLVSACVSARPAVEAPPITETALPASDTRPETPAEGTAEAPVESPVEAHAEVAPVAPPLPPPDLPMLARQRAACQRDGGRLMPRGNGLLACVSPTRDAGRACDEARDCQGLCLARSGTCAPLRPLFGCQEVFTLRGRRETLCTE